jgi:hypothetical protein
MLINRCKFGCSSIQLIEDALPLESSSKTIYHLPLTTGLVHDYKEEIKNFIAGGIKVDGIIVDCYGEGPEQERSRILIRMLEDAGFSKKQILYIDSGLDYFNHCNHAIAPSWIASYKYLAELQSCNELSTRNTLFLSLARIPKYQRTKLIVKMIEHGLGPVSLMSCGSSALEDGIGDNQLFDQLVPDSIRHLFPIIIDDVRVDRYTASTGIDPRFKQCLINVVLESNYENNVYNSDGPSSYCWDRMFYTEKTDKCFMMEQLPLFLAKKGYVDKIRELGFDVFDDVIDHTYDTVVDYNLRIEVLADECNRLAKIGLTKLLQIDRLKERLEKNKMLPSVVKQQYLVEFKHKITQWANNL